MRCLAPDRLERLRRLRLRRRRRFRVTRPAKIGRGIGHLGLASPAVRRLLVLPAIRSGKAGLAFASAPVAPSTPASAPAAPSLRIAILIAARPMLTVAFACRDSLSGFTLVVTFMCRRMFRDWLVRHATFARLTAFTAAASASTPPAAALALAGFAR